MGSDSYRRYDAYKGSKTLVEFAAAGGTIADLRWFKRKGDDVVSVEVEGDAATRAFKSILEAAEDAIRWRGRCRWGMSPPGRRGRWGSVPGVLWLITHSTVACSRTFPNMSLLY